ncbi:hypothetical protein C8F01DRAFT_1083087 [Mycena amicta]|nr:hypothetical protein C8F01DRAFT_1083087 [Mycena amicta]
MAMAAYLSQLCLGVREFMDQRSPKGIVAVRRQSSPDEGISAFNYLRVSLPPTSAERPAETTAKGSHDSLVTQIRPGCADASSSHSKLDSFSGLGGAERSWVADLGDPPSLGAYSMMTGEDKRFGSRRVMVTLHCFFFSPSSSMLGAHPPRPPIESNLAQAVHVRGARRPLVLPPVTGNPRRRARFKFILTLFNRIAYIQHSMGHWRKFIQYVANLHLCSTPTIDIDSARGPSALTGQWHTRPIMGSDNRGSAQIVISKSDAQMPVGTRATCTATPPHFNFKLECPPLAMRLFMINRMCLPPSIGFWTRIDIDKTIRHSTKVARRIHSIWRAMAVLSLYAIQQLRQSRIYLLDVGDLNIGMRLEAPREFAKQAAFSRSKLVHLNRISPMPSARKHSSMTAAIVEDLLEISGTRAPSIRLSPRGCKTDQTRKAR